MAVPTVIRSLVYGTAVGAPVEGPTMGGTYVEIYGNNFRLPPPVPPDATPDPGAPQPRTVQVIFRDPVTATELEAIEARVIRTNLIQFRTPRTPIPVRAHATTPALSIFGEGIVNIIIRNLDDNEDPIPGEEVTLASGFTYRRTRLDAANPSDLSRFVESFVQLWQSHVLPNTLIVQHTDFDAATIDALNIVQIAQLPAVVLAGPDLPENRFYSRNDHEEVEGPNGAVLLRKPHTVDLNFDVLLVGDNFGEMLNLVASAIAFVDQTPFFEFEGNRYEFDFREGGEFKNGSRPNDSNIRVFTSSVVVRALDVSDLASFANQNTTHEPAPPIEEAPDGAPINLDVSPK